MKTFLPGVRIIRAGADGKLRKMPYKESYKKVFTFHYQAKLKLLSHSLVDRH